MTRFTAPTKRDAGKTRKGVSVRREHKEIPQAVSEPTQHPGLCMTCVHTGTCTFRRDVSQAVLECDEFDIGQVAETKQGEPTVAVAKRDDRVEFKGLCVNCDIRHECTFPKPVEGIWHCEEYR